MRKVRWGVLSTAEIGTKQVLLGKAPLAFGPDDAVANMRVIDALFRAARSGAWERP